MMHKQQQGDVIIKRVPRLPEGLKRITVHARGGYVLAEGEATGHAHLLAAEGVEVFEDAYGTLWIKSTQSAALTHEEHHAQVIAPGLYRVDRVREYDPFVEEARRVAD
jgi:hypothetical protein